MYFNKLQCAELQLYLLTSMFINSLLYNTILLLRHYSDPHIPTLSGIDQYTGMVEHSHRYREPKDYADKTVLVLGASASGLDISLDIAKVAKQVRI